MMINLNKVWNDNPFDQWTEEELLCMEGQGICYGKGSSSPPPPPTVTTQTQVSEFPTELRPFISDIFEKSQAVQEQRQAEGFQPELTQQLAPFTGDQQTAFEGIRQQVGQTRPLFEEATELARSSARGATDPAELAALMNPFLRNVVDIEKREAERVADVQEQQLAARAAQAGAFGGSRAGIIEAERQRNLATQLGDIESRGLALAFQDAQNRLQNQFGREASAAGQLASLGTAIPAQTFKELGALSGIGAAEQQQGQRALDIATQQAREEFGFPQQTLQDFSSILRGFPLPATTNVSKSTFSPAQPLSTQLIGLGAGLAGLAGNAGAFGKAGGRVGALAPIGLKNGGYIKLAGGGGLGEMMQENLPSNRVRMGKVAYQDATPSATVDITEQMKEFEIEGLHTLLKKAVGRPASEVKVILEEASRRFNPELVKQGAAALRAEHLLPANLSSSPGTPADTATAAITKASTPVPSPSSGARTKPLSVIERMMGSLDEAVTGPDRGGSASSVTVPLGPKMGVKVPQVDEQAQTVTTGLPPAPPQLLSGDPTASPEQTLKESVQQFLQKPILGATDYSGTGDEGLAAMMARTKFGSDVGSLFEGETGEEYRKRIAQPNRPMLSIGDIGSKVASYFTDTPEKFEEGQRERARKLAEKKAAISGRKEIEGGVDPDPVDPNISSATALSPDIITDDAEVSTIASTPDGGVAEEFSFLQVDEANPAAKPADPAARPTGPANVTQDKADYDKQIADIKSKDYSDDIKAMLGDAPTYEKGEEPDFAARKWLALANFGAGLLASGGGKTLAQSVGEAAKPALKELADIGKEERKIKTELRKERNAQKRADYQDNLKRFDLQRQLKSDDLKMYTGLAKIRQQEEANKISATNAQTNKNRMISENATRKVQRVQKQFEDIIRNKGQLTFGEADKIIEQVLKRSSTAAQTGAKSIVTGMTDTKKLTESFNAAFNAELPTLVSRLEGRLVDQNGNLVSRERIMLMLGKGTSATSPRRKEATIQGLTVPPDSEGNPVGTKPVQK